MENRNGAMQAECWGIWAERSEDSIFGADANWLRLPDGSQATFESECEAADAAYEMQENMSSPNLAYSAREIKNGTR